MARCQRDHAPPVHARQCCIGSAINADHGFIQGNRHVPQTAIHRHHAVTQRLLPQMPLADVMSEMAHNELSSLSLTTIP